MNPAVRPANRFDLARRAAGLVFLCVSSAAGISPPAFGAEGPGGEIANPYLGQPQAIEEGERLYLRHCFGCHFRNGGRGPNLFDTELGEEAFLLTVLQGRKKGWNMPAFGYKLSTEEVWRIHAFVRSRDRY